MLNIPEVIKELFMRDGIRKNFRVHFPNGERADLVNKDIIEESVKFTESTCSQQTLRFGLTEASVIEFECVGVENIAGMTIECGIEIDVSSLSHADRQAYGTWTDDVPFQFYAVPYGVFVVDKCPRQADMKRRKVTGYTMNVSATAAPISLVTKGNKITLSLSNYLDKVSISPDNAEELTVRQTDELYISTKLGTSTTANTNLYCRNIITWAYAETQAYYADEPAVIRCDYAADIYDEGGLDEYVDQFYNSAPISVTDYVYDKTNTRQYQNTEQAVAANLGALRPHAIVTLSGGECYPIFFKNGEPFIVNPADQIRLYGTTIQGMYTVTILIPIAWRRTGEWGSDGPGWFGRIDLGADFEERERPAPKIYAKTGEALPVAWLELTTDKVVNFRALGNYYYFAEFSNAEFSGQMLELYGGYARDKRNGSVEVKALLEDQRENISTDTIEEAWYEEGATKKIGYAILEENGDEVLVQTDTPAKGPGVYDMGAPMWVKYRTGTDRRLVRWLRFYFRDNAASAQYTPVDAKVRGRPWLESGDAIRIETTEGEAVDTYILRRTISGVQHLVDDIEAQGEV